MSKPKDSAKIEQVRSSKFQKTATEKHRQKYVMVKKVFTCSRELIKWKVAINCFRFIS